VKETPEATASLIWNLTYLVRDLAILCSPYIPTTSDRIAKVLGTGPISWKDLGTFTGIGEVARPDLLFARLEDKEIDALRARFSGSQKERKEAAETAAQAAAPSPAEIAARFRTSVDLRAAKIVEIARHPDAEKLYVETVDMGTGTRTIVSGLVPHYTEEELRGHTVVLVANLKPAMLRGVESQGMLLAGSEGKVVEVLFVDHARPGDRVTLTGTTGPAPTDQIDVDTFFSMPISVEASRVVVGDAALECGGRPVVTSKVAKGRVK
jgi:methionyl-tRNA synthetase